MSVLWSLTGGNRTCQGKLISVAIDPVLTLLCVQLNTFGRPFFAVTMARARRRETMRRRAFIVLPRVSPCRRSRPNVIALTSNLGGYRRRAWCLRQIEECERARYLAGHFEVVVKQQFTGR
jgi:hypothetical protein